MNYITTFNQLYESVDTKEVVSEFINDTLVPLTKNEQQKEVLGKVIEFFNTNQTTINDMISKFTIKESTQLNFNEFSRLLDSIKSSSGLNFSNILTSQNLLVAFYAVMMYHDKSGVLKWPVVVTSYLNYKKDQNEINLLMLILTILSALPLGIGPGLIKTIVSTVGIIPGIGWIAGLLLAPIALASGPILSLAPYFALLQAPKALNDSTEVFTEQQNANQIDPQKILEDIVNGAKYYYDKSISFLQSSGIGPTLMSVGSTLTDTLSNFYQKIKKSSEEDPWFSLDKDKPGFIQRLAKQTTPTQYGGFRFPRGKAG